MKQAGGLESRTGEQVPLESSTYRAPDSDQFCGYGMLDNPVANPRYGRILHCGRWFC